LYTHSIITRGLGEYPAIITRGLSSASLGYGDPVCIFERAAIPLFERDSLSVIFERAGLSATFERAEIVMVFERDPISFIFEMDEKDLITSRELPCS
jgi:hypothetical protein